MKTNTLKQIAILAVSTIGLYYSGLNLIDISSIQTLFDALNVMTFFSCLFPFSILFARLSAQLLKSFSKLLIS